MIKCNGYNDGGVGLRQVAIGEIDFTKCVGASSGAEAVCVLPAGCIITDTRVQIIKEFDGGTPTLNVGKNASVNDMLPSASITAGTIGFYKAASPVVFATTAETTIQAKLAKNGADPTQGKARIMVDYQRVAAE